jgi:signal peptidase II
MSKKSPDLPGKASLVPHLVLMACLVLLDQLSKWVIMAYLMPGAHRQIIPGFFNLTYVTNTGAAFSFLAGPAGGWRQVFFVVVSVVALVGIGWAMFAYRRQGVLFLLGLAGIGGGAAGNLIDRLRFGAVVDFLDFYVGRYHWPAFNVADSAITVGVGLFLLATILSDDK